MLRPVRAFLQTESASAVLLLGAAFVALLWANSPWDARYFDLWDRDTAREVGPFDTPATLRLWVNEGLMAVFFLVAGLELKRELTRGELASRRLAALPIAAALGGMVVPALISTAFNAGGEGARGWGIPMATDIAFALGVLALLGRRVPLALKVFVLSLAIVDDLGAILVIAVFYAGHIEAGWLALSVSLLALVAVLIWAELRTWMVLLPLGLLAWAAMLQSGVHPTIVGVALGLLAPGRAAPGLEAGLDRLENRLHPWSSYLVVPIFALANAGLALNRDFVEAALESEVTAGVVAGLVLGKPLGIVAFAWLAVRLGLASLPREVRWPHLAGAGMLAGIGFTVSLFIASLAFDDPALADQARAGVLAASVLAGVLGCAALALATRPR